jgi:hypothetical protein
MEQQHSGVSALVRWAGDLLDQADTANVEDALPHNATAEERANAMETLYTQTKLQLDKAKQLLIKREEKYKTMMDAQIDAQREEFENKVKEIKESLHANQTEFEIALSAKNQSAASFERRIKDNELRFEEQRVMIEKLELVSVLFSERIWLILGL